MEGDMGLPVVHEQAKLYSSKKYLLESTLVSGGEDSDENNKVLGCAGWKQEWMQGRLEFVQFM